MAQTLVTVAVPVVVKVPDLNENSGTNAITFWGPADRAYTVSSVNWEYGVKGGSGATINIYKDTGTTAPGGGTSILVGGTALDVGASTAVVANTLTNNTLNVTAGVTSIAVGDRLSYKLAGTLTALANATMTIVLTPA